MTNGNRRRLSLSILGLCMVLIAAIGWQMWRGVQENRAIRYGGKSVMQATPYALCPGSTFSYPQEIHVVETAMVDISRDWCNRGFTCDLSVHQSWQNVVLTPLDFSGPVTRTVPPSALWKPGRLYEFRSGVKNGELSVQVIQFSIRDDCEVQP